MPGDTRRINGPEETFYPPKFAVGVDIDSKHTLLDENGRRADDRNHDQLRPVFVQAGVISKAKGSAYIEIGQTKVMCAVYGPRQVARREDFSMNGQLSCELKYATFSTQRRRSHQLDNHDKDMSVIVMETLEPAVCLDKFPKAIVDVFVTVLQDDGSALAAAITCASVALADAEIEMYDIVIGTTVRQTDETMILDPTNEEEYKPQVRNCESINNGMVTIGYLPSLNQISCSALVGQMLLENISQAVKVAVTSCLKIYPVVQKTILESVKQKRSKTTSTNS
ncbi:exosome complex component MTR3-like [Tubulanus polymorphus]|uniref:exosome complex component MTR3-like n=1 Tax=Tubulanus polymorphus TaxID=672921 RepID=UPI003DA4096A